MWPQTFTWLAQMYSRDFGNRDWSKPDLQAASDEEGAAFAARMQPVLTKFEVMRVDTYTQAESAARIWVPLGLVLGLAGTYISLHFKFDPVAALFAPVLGVVLGMYLATNAVIAQYRATFKSDVIPHLLSRFGDFKQCEAPVIDTTPLRSAGILSSECKVKIEDEIAGTHRDRKICMGEMLVTRETDDKVETLFDGLVLQFELPRDVSGRTLIFPKGFDLGSASPTSWFGRSTQTSDGLEPVVLESPEFRERYSVLSNDQVGARVLLSPAFMERLQRLEPQGTPRRRSSRSLNLVQSLVVSGLEMQLRRGSATRSALSRVASNFNQSPTGSGTSRVVAIAENGVLMMAVPKRDHIDYFEPPPYYATTDADAVLMHLSIDIQTMLDVADAVFDLDYRTRVAEGERGKGIIGKTAVA